MIQSEMLHAFQNAVGKTLNPHPVREGIAGFARLKGKWQFVCWPVDDDFEPDYSALPNRWQVCQAMNWKN